jgi:ribosomal protein S18 acetylase RimI-like enzyme
METRLATPEDAALIAAHRRAMFAEMRASDEATLDAMSVGFVPWVASMLASSRYLGWVIEERAQAAASAGLLLLDWPPHPLDPAGAVRGYLLNVYVEPEFRRRGLAKALVERCMDEARERGIRVVTLHASDAGRSIYEGLGFHTTNEMMLSMPGRAAD